MIKNDCNVRSVNKEEYRTTEEMARDSFWNVYRPGCLEHFVLHCIRQSADYNPALDFVLEKDGEIIGRNIFCPAFVTSAGGTQIAVFTMGPVYIRPEYQGKGYGRYLLEKSLEAAARNGVKAVFIEGDINFYGKSGFVPASEYGIGYHGLPRDADASFFLCKELEKGFLSDVKGEYSTPQVYFVDEKRREEFDTTFPHREKQVLPTQIF